MSSPWKGSLRAKRQLLELLELASLSTLDGGQLFHSVPRLTIVGTDCRTSPVSAVTASGTLTKRALLCSAGFRIPGVSRHSLYKNYVEYQDF